MAFNSAKLPGYFVCLSISDQIKQLFTKETFATNILYRFKRSKLNPDHYEDIYDGLLYKKLVNSIVTDVHLHTFIAYLISAQYFLNKFILQKQSYLSSLYQWVL